MHEILVTSSHTYVSETEMALGVYVYSTVHWVTIIIFQLCMYNYSIGNRHV